MALARYLAQRHSRSSGVNEVVRCLAPRRQTSSLHTRTPRLWKSSSGKQVFPHRLSMSVCVRLHREMILHFLRRLRHGRHPVRDRRLLSGKCLMTGMSLVHWSMAVVMLHCGAAGHFKCVMGIERK
jgi:hypothetical protein